MITRVVVLCLLVLGFLSVVVTGPAHPRDNGQWEETSPEVRAWYRNLMMPDNPSLSCCGEADAYWADSFESVDGKLEATITDTRPMCDGSQEKLKEGCVPGRPHIPFGTKVVVPNHKMKYDASNPTGHGILFINTQLQVLCYIMPGGV